MKTIRPLSRLKSVEPEIYEHYKKLTEFINGKSSSQKSEENNIYWFIGIAFLSKRLSNEKLKSFFYKLNGEPKNKGSVSQIGRVLLFGWYYKIEPFTEKILELELLRCICKKLKDKEISEELKLIRINLLEYY